MTKKIILGLILARYDPNLVQKIFFHGFYFHYMLNIVASYDCTHFQGKRMNQTWKTNKKN